MTPEQALSIILETAKNAVLVARPGGQLYGLTFQDHAAMQQAENVLGEMMQGRTINNGKETEGNGETDRRNSAWRKWAFGT